MKKWWPWLGVLLGIGAHLAIIMVAIVFISIVGWKEAGAFFLAVGVGGAIIGVLGGVVLYVLSQRGTKPNTPPVPVPAPLPPKHSSWKWIGWGIIAGGVIITVIATVIFILFLVSGTGSWQVGWLGWLILAALIVGVIVAVGTGAFFGRRWWRTKYGTTVVAGGKPVSAWEGWAKIVVWAMVLLTGAFLALLIVALPLAIVGSTNADRAKEQAARELYTFMPHDPPPVFTVPACSKESFVAYAAGLKQGMSPPKEDLEILPHMGADFTPAPPGFRRHYRIDPVDKKTEEKYAVWLVEDNDFSQAVKIVFPAKDLPDFRARSSGHLEFYSSAPYPMKVVFSYEYWGRSQK